MVCENVSKIDIFCKSYVDWTFKPYKHKKKRVLQLRHAFFSWNWFLPKRKDTGAHSGKLAYRALKLMTTVIPSMKEDFTDVDTALEKAQKINEKNKYTFPTDNKSLYEELTISGYPCLVIRSKKAELRKNEANRITQNRATRKEQCLPTASLSLCSTKRPQTVSSLPSSLISPTFSSAISRMSAQDRGFSRSAALLCRLSTGSPVIPSFTSWWRPSSERCKMQKLRCSCRIVRGYWK